MPEAPRVPFYMKAPGGRGSHVWLREAAAIGVVEIVPLDVEVVIALADLPAAFHGDPADPLIVATASADRLPLATHDRAIRSSRAVKLWRRADRGRGPERAPRRSLSAATLRHRRSRMGRDSHCDARKLAGGRHTSVPQCGFKAVDTRWG